MSQLNKLIEAKIAEYADMDAELTIEQAEDLVRQEGYTENVGGGWPFTMADVPELKLANFFGTSRFKGFNVAAKKAKDGRQFEEDNFYLGPKVVKTKEGSFDLESSELGIHIGEEAEILVVGTKFFGERRYDKAARDSAKKEGRNLPPDIATCFGNSMMKGDQALMICKNTGRNLLDIRNELVKQYGSSQDTLKEERVSMFNYVFGLVKTTDGWKPFWTREKALIGPDALTQVILSIPKMGKSLQGTTVKFIAEYSEKDSRVIKRAELGNEVAKEEKKEIIPMILELSSKFKALQAEQEMYLKGRTPSAPLEAQESGIDPEMEDIFG